MARCIDKTLCDNSSERNCIIRITDKDGNEVDISQMGPGDIVYLHVPDRQGYEFMQWQDGDGNTVEFPYIGELDAYEVTLSYDYCNMSFFAIFQEIPIQLTLVATPENAGDLYGGGYYFVNTEVPVTCIERNGYHFSEWRLGSVNGETISTTLNFTYTMPSQDVTLYAIFSSNQYTIIGIPNINAYGSVMGSGTFSYGETATLTATPNAGCQFVNWTDSVTGQVVSTSAIYVISPVVENRLLVANFIKQEFSVTLDPNSDVSKGTVLGLGTFQYGYNDTVTITANTGYKIAEWTIDGVTQSLNNLPYSFQVTANVVVGVRFEQDVYTLTLTASPTDGGTVNPATSTYHYGDVANFSCAANTDYIFNSWSDGNNSTSRSLTINGNTSLIAYFTKDQVHRGKYYAIAETNDDYTQVYGYAKIKIAGVEMVSTSDYNSEEYWEDVANTAITLEAEPKTGYQFTEWRLWDNYQWPYPTTYTVNTNNPMPQTIPETGVKCAMAMFEIARYCLTIETDLTTWPGGYDRYVEVSYNIADIPYSQDMAVWPVFTTVGGEQVIDHFLDAYTSGNPPITPTVGVRYRVEGPINLQTINSGFFHTEWQYVEDEDYNLVLTQVREAYMLVYNQNNTSFTICDIPINAQVFIDAKHIIYPEINVYCLSEVGAYYPNEDLYWNGSPTNSMVTCYTGTMTGTTTVLMHFG